MLSTGARVLGCLVDQTFEHRLLGGVQTFLFMDVNVDVQFSHICKRGTYLHQKACRQLA